MTPEKLADIEQKLGFKIPAEYRRFLEHYPAELKQCLQAEGSTKYVNDSLYDVYLMTLLLRRDGLYEEECPRNYLGIGEDEFGNYFFLDASRSPAPVLFFDHEWSEFEERASSIDEWWPRVLALHRRVGGR